MTDAANVVPEEWLANTPYLVGEDEASVSRFLTVYNRSVTTKTRAREVAAQVAGEAHGILESFAKALRTDLVAESNRLEGYEWTSSQVKDVVEVHRELINAPLHHFMTAMRSDPHLMEALGLYRAHVIADEWLENGQRPHEYEIRGLHSLILAGTPSAGRYKTKINEIQGSEHVPADPWDVRHAMTNMVEWWLKGSPDPVLDATVIHAWLTHIHPFDDGNGRLARLLANLALTQSSYPPLIIRSQSDRGQYLEALAASDDGDVLPLYDFFTSVLKRSVKTMARPGYASDFVQDRLLITRDQRYEAWLFLTRQFTDCLRSAIRARGWDAHFQGYPELTGFILLSEREPSGHSWHLRVDDPNREPKWLLFFGFNSNEMVELLNKRQSVPSIFFSARDNDPAAVHRFKRLFEQSYRYYDIPQEVVILPGELKPAMLRKGDAAEMMSLEAAADEIAKALIEA